MASVAPPKQQTDNGFVPIYKAWKARYTDSRVEGSSRCSFMRLMRSRSNPSEHFAVWLPCDKCDCPNCGPVRKGRWEAAIWEHIKEAPYIEELTVPVESWEAAQRAMERKQAHYAKFQVSKAVYRIMTTEKMGGREVVEAKRLNVLQAFLKVTPFKRGAVSTSRSWKKKAAPVKEDKEYEVLGSSKAFEPEEVSTHLKIVSEDIHQQKLTVPHRDDMILDAIRFYVPVEFMLNRDKYKEVLRCMGLKENDLERALEIVETLKATQVPRAGPPSPQPVQLAI